MLGILRFCQQLGVKMAFVPLLLVGVYLIGFATSQGRLAKRIAEGVSLWSQDNYGTYHFLSLRTAWGCISNQWVHALGGCEERLDCGGTLFHPEFVITAAHCVTYHEFYERNLSKIFDLSTLVGRGARYPENIGYYELLERNVTVFAVFPEFKHAFYSNKVWLGGSVDYVNPTQKRHAYKIFPHPKFGYGRFSLVDHDVSMIQLCEPFKMTSTVQVVKILPLNELKAHWGSIVERTAACLYVGFGITNDSSLSFKISSSYSIPTRYLQYAWRQVACPSICNYNRTLGFRAPRNLCISCSVHISPKLGTGLAGDSGGPIMCDGYYTGLHNAGYYMPHKNLTIGFLYPIYCSRDYITPKSLEYYKSLPPKGYHPMSAGRRRFQFR